ncbi:type II toxin-antitoxin system ParD family antitoxin [Sphingomonas sp. LT1P40]|uniref:type II toxin-antitoxin system ParD family antitoxin n=1 Tax=Alteristakelama amylovorans TaxID=3096166 RepID=UPI002FCC86D9
MVMLNISLPEAMERWIDSQTRSGRFADGSDLIRSLIQREQERTDRIAAMQQYVNEARESGVSGENMAAIRDRALTKAKQG